MSAREQRRLRHAVTQLAACDDGDIAWIMDTLTASQREHLTSLIESATLMAAADGGAPDTRLDAVFAATPAFLLPRFRQAIEPGTGEGQLTESTREALAKALLHAAASVPAQVAGKAQRRGGMRGRFGRWLGIRT